MLLSGKAATKPGMRSGHSETTSAMLSLASLASSGLSSGPASASTGGRFSDTICT